VDLDEKMFGVAAPAVGPGQPAELLRARKQRHAARLSPGRSQATSPWFQIPFRFVKVLCARLLGVL
jgi:hypothetical protein